MALGRVIAAECDASFHFRWYCLSCPSPLTYPSCCLVVARL